MTEKNLELALQEFAMSHRIQVLDFGRGLNPSHLPNGMTRNMKIRRLHLSKSLEDAHLKKVWMAASNVVVQCSQHWTVELANSPQLERPRGRSICRRMGTFQWVGHE